MDRRIFFVTTGGSLLAACAAPKREEEPQPDLAALLEVMRTPGLAAGGTVAGRPIRLTGGVREAGKAEPVTSTTVFSAASLSKPVFAMEVRRLVREGRLDWKKPLQDYLPLGLSGDAAAITAEHVLTHGTGLPNWRFDPKAELACAFKPGTSWQYSGEGYVLLQRVVEKIVGEPLGAHLNGSLLPRLGMTSSTFTWSPDIEKRAVSGHDHRGLPLERSSVFYEKAAFALAERAGSSTDRMTYEETMDAARRLGGSPLAVAVVPNAAGSLWTTLDDYVAFLKASVDDAAAHPDEYAPVNRVNPVIAWTRSWGIDHSLGTATCFHWGDGPGVKNFALWQPQGGTALAVFTNGDHGASAYRMLLRQLLRADPVAPDWV